MSDSDVFSSACGSWPGLATAIGSGALGVTGATLGAATADTADFVAPSWGAGAVGRAATGVAAAEAGAWNNQAAPTVRAAEVPAIISLRTTTG